ncbi:MAG: thioredoxin family protein [Archaeoglobaceae archaeon]|nr:thioredoxin family protein [Archaeoglobaceae archaeon]
MQENEKVIVDVWAEWCVPCKMMSPIFEELAKEYLKIVFAELDADKNMRIVEKYKIRGIPAYLFFKRGELVDMLVGTTQRGI